MVILPNNASGPPSPRGCPQSPTPTPPGDELGGERGEPYRGGSLKSSNARNLSNYYAEYLESRPRRRMGDDGWSGDPNCEAGKGHAWNRRTAVCVKCGKTLTEVHGH